MYKKTRAAHIITWTVIYAYQATLNQTRSKYTLRVFNCNMRRNASNNTPTNAASQAQKISKISH